MRKVIDQKANLFGVCFQVFMNSKPMSKKTLKGKWQGGYRWGKDGFLYSCGNAIKRYFLLNTTKRKYPIKIDSDSDEEKALAFLAENHPSENLAFDCMWELRDKYDQSYMWCEDCDGRVVKKKDCCLKNPPKDGQIYEF
jgi:hypothetical protein